VCGGGVVVLSFRRRRVEFAVAALMFVLVAGGEVDCAAAAWLFFI
jgi:hypothetical protein